MKFTKTHEWIKFENNIATIGITDHAQSELSDIVFIKLPTVGDEFKIGDTMCTIESVKAASDIYSPITGKVIEVNSSLDDNPEKVNQSPEDEGWLTKLEVSNPSELEELMDNTAYQAFIKD